MPVVGQGILACALVRSVVGALSDWLPEAVLDKQDGVVGVSSEDQHRYTCHEEPCIFSCETTAGQESLPISVVNDDFCDCVDGSDEPGTSACAGLDGTLFHCRNADGIPKLLYTSRIRDGICDCCDGSGERVGRASPCSNTCQEEKVERERLVERLQKGLEKHKESRREAKNTRQRWREEVESLKKQLPQLQQDLARAKAAQGPELSAAVAQLSTLQEQLKQLKAEVAALKKGQEELRQRALLETSVSASPGSEASPPEIEASTSTVAPAAAAPVEPAVEPSAEPAAEPASEAVVSEYAKWMEKADEVLNVASTTSTTTTTTAAVTEEVPVVVPPLSEVEREAALQLNQTEIIDKINSTKARLEELEGKLNFLPEEKLAYFSLMDTCLQSESFNGHTYSICFFRSASQAGGTQGNVSLGTWSGWKGQRQIEFKGGKSCGSVPRSLTVKFRCAEETKIMEVTEPGHCVYEAIVSAAGACGKKTREEVERGTPRLRHPREEL